MTHCVQRLPPSPQAVIGGGAAGIVATRELLREGHSVTVFEQGPQVGGVWKLAEDVEDDPLGQQASRKQVHSSMYDALRVNLPRELMGFSDFPFTPDFMRVRAPWFLECICGACYAAYSDRSPFTFACTY